jgi:hypothetical protein
LARVGSAYGQRCRGHRWGKTYCFGNDQAKGDFMKDPDANLAKAETYYSKHHG